MSKSNSETNFKKILLMGMDNSGKTSILLSLQRNTNLLSYYSLNPTRGLDIVKFKDHGSRFNIWDFGGQEEYRKDYLQHLNDYFIDISKMIFVIDIQDIKRYDLALQYLEKIIQALQKNKNHVDFSIFLHKFDPDLEKDEKYADEKLSVNLISKIEKIIPANFDYQIFKTTIFTVFQKRPLNL